MTFEDKINNMASALPAYSEICNPSNLRNIIASKINKIITNNKLSYFYKKDNITPIIDRLCNINWADLAKKWKVSIDVITDLCTLSLYDSIIFVDDSGSMEYEEDGDRIIQMTKYVNKISEIASLFDDDGLNIRFINSPIEANGISCKEQVEELISKIKFTGKTPRNNA